MRYGGGVVGGLIVTGPTGTGVGDVAAALLKLEAGAPVIPSE